MSHCQSRVCLESVRVRLSQLVRVGVLVIDIKGRDLKNKTTGPTPLVSWSVSRFHSVEMTAVCAFFNVPSPQHKRWIDAKAKDRWAAVKLTPLADRPQISDGEKTVVQAVRAWQQRGPVKIVVVGIENECSENARAAVRMLRAGGLVLEGDTTLHTGKQTAQNSLSVGY